MGKFRLISTEISARDTPIFSFPDDNLSKHQWIFTKLDMCIDIVEIWFGIANGQIPSSYLPETRRYLRFQTITWVNNKRFPTNLLYALTLRRKGLGLLIDKFRYILMELSARDTPIFSFPGDNLCKHQWSFTKLGMGIDIVQIWFGIPNGHISSIFDGVICPRHAHIFVSEL